MLNYSAALEQKLTGALKNKGCSYQPRTRHLDSENQPKYTNRLILENSPYLLQHAHNPVDWYPWGETAFATAKQKNKIVFLSIGYSTCHWCHVMEEECFDNDDVARIMNDYFVCIKVDRELLPEVDTFYMTAVMIMQGQGGWPMSSFLTPDKRPFFGGTYFKPAQFITLMNRVNEVWQSQPEDIFQQSHAINQRVVASMSVKQSLSEVGFNTLERTATSILNQYDKTNGGFGQAPKFPNEPYLYFLLEYTDYTGNRDLLDVIKTTLHAQSCGGIYDHIAGGFHRYATDSTWLIPHFEKMLYNQANLSFIFAQAYILTGELDFKRIACEILDYVLREMTDNDGTFYSATDADSEAEEGLFFLWDKTELERLLGSDAEEFIDVYQVTDKGNFSNKNILHLSQSLSQTAKQKQIDPVALTDRLASNKKVLLQQRERRARPLRDDKIISAWNAMMIKSFAYIGLQFKQVNYINAAITAADSILSINKTTTGKFARASLARNFTTPATQEDYAYLAEALLQLYDATLDKKWLVEASKWVDQMLELFWDNEDGGFFMVQRDTVNALPSTPKEVNDNATASGNSVALKTLYRLYKRTGKQHYQTYAQQLVRVYSDDITQRPYICSYLMTGLLEMFVGEQASQQWCAGGNIHISSESVRRESEVEIKLSIQTEPTWYLNQICNGTDGAPLTVTVDGDWVISMVDCSRPTKKTFSYQTIAVDVFAGEIVIQFLARNEQLNLSDLNFPENRLRLKLGLQACNSDKCFETETVFLRLMF